MAIIKNNFQKLVRFVIAEKAPKLKPSKIDKLHNSIMIEFSEIYVDTTGVVKTRQKSLSASCHRRRLKSELFQAQLNHLVL